MALVVRVFPRELYGSNFQASISALNVKDLSMHVISLCHIIETNSRE